MPARLVVLPSTAVLLDSGCGGRELYGDSHVLVKSNTSVYEHFHSKLFEWTCRMEPDTVV